MSRTNTTACTRRSFVAGSAATAALASVAPAAALAEKATEEAPAATPANRWQSEAAAAWQTAPEPVAEDQIADGGTFDVVIVGGGQPGTWAAKYAAKNGLTTAVVEAQEEESHMYIGGEVGTINSPWALAHGATEIDPPVYMRAVDRRNQGRCAERFIKA